MLRSALAGALSALLLAGARPAPAADADQDARAVIARAVQARGGEAALEKYKASDTKFKGKFHGFGANSDTHGSVQSVAPDKLRLESNSESDGMKFTFLYVLDGNKGWFSFNGNTQELDREQLDEARDQLFAGQVADLRGLTAKGVTLTALGESKVDGKPAVGVKVSEPGRRPVSLYFDKETALLLKSQNKGKNPGTGDEFDAETFYGDYRKVKGQMVAHKVAVKHDGQPYNEMEITEITLSETLPDKVFSKP